MKLNFELEQNIWQQAETLAKKSQGRYPAKEWLMSQEDLARFKSADATLLALQRRKAALDRMAAELDDGRALQPAGIMERAERDSPDKVWVQLQDSLHDFLHREPCTFGKI